ncbi:AAA family ATPase [Paenibacillus sabinae]|uniref:AAA family ATPase n=1 Tax=Paenibacillus sabinae TaxID=365617 RepID=UPI00130DB04A|nr:AAA family ATPase [Paenibacillus sabinae]
MRIQRLEIGGFGRLHGKELELAEGLTVLYGPNEAGKSTLLQFIRAMLFGIPGRSYPSERLEPLHGGRHGGTLTARDAKGNGWSIRRYAAGPEGGRGDRLKITFSGIDGTVEEFGQDELEKMLLGGVSRTMFRQLFAVSLDELQELGTLQSKELGSFLFHAGIGGGGEILRAERRLQQEAEKLYKPRGKTQEAAKVLQSIERLEREIAESRSYLPRYNKNTAAMQSAESELDALERRRREESDRLARLRKALDIRELWLKREAARQELRELPELPSFPEDVPERWRELQTRTANARQAEARAGRIASELKEELMRTVPDRLLEAQGPRLERLLRHPGWVRKPEGRASASGGGTAGATGAFAPHYTRHPPRLDRDRACGIRRGRRGPGGGAPLCRLICRLRSANGEPRRRAAGAARAACRGAGDAAAGRALARARGAGSRRFVRGAAAHQPARDGAAVGRAAARRGALARGPAAAAAAARCGGCRRARPRPAAAGAGGRADRAAAGGAVADRRAAGQRLARVRRAGRRRSGPARRRARRAPAARCPAADGRGGGRSRDAAAAGAAARRAAGAGQPGCGRAGGGHEGAAAADGRLDGLAPARRAADRRAGPPPDGDRGAGRPGAGAGPRDGRGGRRLPRRVGPLRGMASPPQAAGGSVSGRAARHFRSGGAGE